MTKLFALRKRKAHKNKTKKIKRFRYNFTKKTSIIKHYHN